MSDSYTEFGKFNINQETAQEIKQRGFGVVGSGPRPDQLMAYFEQRRIPNRFRSKEMGRPIYDYKDMLIIEWPGESHTRKVKEANDQDKRMYARQWEQYSAGKAQIPEGTPLNLLFPESMEIVDMLNGQRVYTVQQLAKLSADGIQNIGMGAQEWVNRAQKFQAEADKGVNQHRFEQAMKEKDSQIGTLERQVRELSEQLNKFMRREVPPTNFDHQSAQIAAGMAQQQFNQVPQTFSSNIGTRQRKQRSDKGVARGSRKET